MTILFIFGLIIAVGGLYFYVKRRGTLQQTFEKLTSLADQEAEIIRLRRELSDANANFNRILVSGQDAPLGMVARELAQMGSEASRKALSFKA